MAPAAAESLGRKTLTARIAVIAVRLTAALVIQLALWPACGMDDARHSCYGVPCSEKHSFTCIILTRHDDFAR